MPQLPFSFRALAKGETDKGEIDAEAPDPTNRNQNEASPRSGAATKARVETPTPRRARSEASGRPREEAAPKVLSVTELQRMLRLQLERDYAALSVRGEVSNLRVQSSGHAYFTLKDRRAQLNCVLFAQERSRLRFRLADGLSVIATGRVTIYDRSGSLQLRVLRCEPEGEGALWAEFQERARKLRAEGLTDPARKRPLPAHAARVGVVTSRTGAALRDIVRTLIRRDPSVRIRICHAQVQGRRAAGDLVSALRCLDRFGDCDVLILARGGGSIEDLWAFNEEPVARAIVACRTPVIVGVGHETDLTIADMVADHSASTPTAAAAAAVDDRAETKDRLKMLEARLERATRHRVADLGHRLRARASGLDLARPPLHRWAQQVDQLHHRAHSSIATRLSKDQSQLRAFQQRLSAAAPAVRLEKARQALERMPERLQAALQSRLTASEIRLSRLADRLDPATRRRLDTARASLQHHAGRLEALSPLAVLHRGYGLVRTTDGAVVRDADSLTPGQGLSIRVARGTIEAEVQETNAPDPDDGLG